MAVLDLMLQVTLSSQHKAVPEGVSDGVSAGGNRGKSYTINPPPRSALNWEVPFAVYLTLVPVLRHPSFAWVAQSDTVWQKIDCVLELSDKKQSICLMRYFNNMECFFMPSLSHKAVFLFMQRSQHLQFSHVDTLLGTRPLTPSVIFHRIF